MHELKALSEFKTLKDTAFCYKVLKLDQNPHKSLSGSPSLTF